MFVGHVALGLVAKTVAPRVSLAWLVFCAELSDLLWAVFVLVGLEHTRVVPGHTAASPLDLYDIPYSHSAGALFVWSVLAAAPWLYTRRFREAALIAGLVLSHFALDVVSHRPDMPLTPRGDTVLGLGLWHSRALSLVVEGGLWAAAVALYTRRTSARTGFGRYGWWALVALLTVAWLGGMYGAPPPSGQAAAGAMLLALVLCIAWLGWIDTRRPLRRAAPSRSRA